MQHLCFLSWSYHVSYAAVLQPNHSSVWSHTYVPSPSLDLFPHGYLDALMIIQLVTNFISKHRKLCAQYVLNQVIQSQAIRISWYNEGLMLWMVINFATSNSWNFVVGRAFCVGTAAQPTILYQFFLIKINLRIREEWIWRRYFPDQEHQIVVTIKRLIILA